MSRSGSTSADQTIRTASAVINAGSTLRRRPGDAPPGVPSPMGSTPPPDAVR